MSLAQTSARVETWTAMLVANERITPPESSEDVRRLSFTTGEASFEGGVGKCVKAMTPGLFGEVWHERLYSISEAGLANDCLADFEILVRRCYVVDELTGERFDGASSNHLCDLTYGDEVRFSGPYGHPFPIPADSAAPLLMIGMGTGIAPFRGLVHRIHDEIGGWRGPVKLFYGARSGLEMLYLNDEHADFGLYFDRPTYQAFKAVSPRPQLNEPPTIDRALWERIDEVWAMLQSPRAQLYLAGPLTLLPLVESALASSAGSMDKWRAFRAKMVAQGRWHEVLY